MVAGLGLVCAAGIVSAAPGMVTPQQAIAAAVADILGASASISVDGVETRVAGEPGLVAAPEPAARFAKRSRFVLSVAGERRGIATATVTATAAYPRATRDIARDEEIGPDAVDFIRGELPDLPIRRVLSPPDVEGTTARRTIAAGEALTLSVVKRAPVVKSGDDVEATVRIGPVQVTGAGVASGSGQVGDTIRIMQPHSSRLLRARITGPGAVEIIE